MSILIDKPKTSITEDRFGFARYAKQIADDIATSTELGYVVGIFGGWGSGKSTLMNFVGDALGKTPARTRVLIVRFNAWKYDNRMDMVAALLMCIVDTIKREYPKRFENAGGEKLWGTLKGVGSALLKSGARAASFYAGIPGLENFPNDVREEVRKALSAPDQQYSQLVEVEKELRSAINDIAGSGRIVILLDDLDRCLPENAISVLEALKLFLEETRCVFVVGVDDRVLAEAVAHHYGADPAQMGRNYLDKIVQYQFNVPPVTTGTLRSAFQDQLNSLELDEKSIDILLLGSQENPRNLIRILNAFGPAKEIVLASGWERNEANMRLFAFLTCLKVRFPSFYEVCSLHPRVMSDVCQFFQDRNRLITEDVFQRNGWDPYWPHARTHGLHLFLQRVTGLGEAVNPWMKSKDVLAQAIALGQ